MDVARVMLDVEKSEMLDRERERGKPSDERRAESPRIRRGRVRSKVARSLETTAKRHTTAGLQDASNEE
jgi:hypothetical protein